MDVCILKGYLRFLLIYLDRIAIQISVLLRERLLLSQSLLEPIHELRQAQRIDELMTSQDDLLDIAVRWLILNYSANDLGLLIRDVHHSLPNHVFGNQGFASIVEIREVLAVFLHNAL